MKTKDLMVGINILLKYYDNLDGWFVGCEHDQLYMFSTDKPVSPEDAQKLHELGWFQEGIEAPNYSLDESWSAFV